MGPWNDIEKSEFLLQSINAYGFCQDVYRLRYSRLWASVSACSIALVTIFFFCTILQDNNIREKILTKFHADIHRYTIDEEVVAGTGVFTLDTLYFFIDPYPLDAQLFFDEIWNFRN